MAVSAPTGRHAQPAATSAPPRLPGFLLGVGLGGFVDGIALARSRARSG